MEARGAHDYDQANAWFLYARIGGGVMLVLVEYGDRCRRCAELVRAGDIVDKASETGPRCLECMARYAGRYYTEDELQQVKPKLGRRERLLMLRMWKPGEVVYLNGERVENVVGYNQDEGIVRYRVLDENGRITTVKTERGDVRVSTEKDAKNKQPESKKIHDASKDAKEQNEQESGAAGSNGRKKTEKNAK